MCARTLCYRKKAMFRTKWLPTVKKLFLSFYEKSRATFGKPAEPLTIAHGLDNLPTRMTSTGMRVVALPPTRTRRPTSVTTRPSMDDEVR